MFFDAKLKKNLILKTIFSNSTTNNKKYFHEQWKNTIIKKSRKIFVFFECKFYFKLKKWHNIFLNYNLAKYQTYFIPFCHFVVQSL